MRSPSLIVNELISLDELISLYVQGNDSGLVTHELMDDHLVGSFNVVACINQVDLIAPNFVAAAVFVLECIALPVLLVVGKVSRGLVITNPLVVLIPQLSQRPDVAL